MADGQVHDELMMDQQQQQGVVPQQGDIHLSPIDKDLGDAALENNVRQVSFQ